MSKSKAGHIAFLLFNVLLLLEYVGLLYLILAKFEFMPWYASDASFILYYILWLPLCLTTLIVVVLNIASRVIYRLRIMLLCFNAVIMPLLFAADFVGSAVLNYMLAAFSLVTVVAYYIVAFKIFMKKSI